VTRSSPRSSASQHRSGEFISPGSRHAIPMTATGVTLALSNVPDPSLPLHKFLSLLHTLSQGFLGQGFEKYNRILLCELETLACHGYADPRVLPSREAVVSVVVVSNRVAGAKPVNQSREDWRQH